ncbi:MAG: hypothetical protein EAZ48_06125 [Flavobacteriia bacterium]|nr:MAG: hypothetical protein EAZ48_06125 [Flavobacteriia bacterium]
MPKFLLLLFYANLAYAQTQIYFPRVSGKEHERALFSIENGQFLSGSSHAVVRLHDINGQVLLSQQLAANLKEIRAIAPTENGYIAMQSHDSSGIVLLNKSLQTDTVIYPLGKRTDLFLDGICAQGNLVFLLGDPIDGFFSTFRSTDFGLHWEATPAKVMAVTGQAAYAASGQTCQIVGSQIYFVSGGTKSALHYSPNFGASWQTFPLPFPSCLTCGPYALTVLDSLRIVVVGGDYTQPENNQNTCFYTQDGGKTWQTPKRSPAGYRSCVYHIGDLIYCCGTNGIERSTNCGKTWEKLYGVNALSMTFNGCYIYASLANGTLLRFKP